MRSAARTRSGLSPSSSTRPEGESRPIRLVLLARNAGEWRTTLHEETPAAASSSITKYREHIGPSVIASRNAPRRSDSRCFHDMIDECTGLWNFRCYRSLDMLPIFIEKEMRRTALALSLLAVLVSLRPRQAEAESQDVLGKLSITQQNWRHSGKLLIVDITFRNNNSFPLKGVIVSCQITGDPARPQDSRGVTIRQTVSRGDTTVSGIEFPVTHDKAQGGPCKVQSAEQAP
jgi:hypothetical protein